MTDWIGWLDAIIQLNGRELLTHAGKISHQMAQEKAVLEYDSANHSGVSSVKRASGSWKRK